MVDAPEQRHINTPLHHVAQGFSVFEVTNVSHHPAFTYWSNKCNLKTLK